MNRLVIDASVALKWVVPERHGDHAALVLNAAANGQVLLHVPALWASEVAHALWQKTRRTTGRLTVAEASRSLRQLRSVAIEEHPDTELIPVAFALACEAGITVYDALYAALALREDALLVTDDEPLAEILASTDAGECVVLLRSIERVLS